MYEPSEEPRPPRTCATPTVGYGSVRSGPLPMREERPTEPLRHTDGRVHVPEGPRLGVGLDPAAVARLTRC
jgi:muconate cycloisomerase